MRPTVVHGLIFKSSKAFFMASALLVFFVAPASTHADFEVTVEQSLSVENAGTLYQGYEGDPAGFVPTVINGDSIASPSRDWTVNFLKPFNNSVPATQGVYVLFRNAPDPTPEDGPETDFVIPGQNFEMVHAPVPADAGPATVSFPSLPALGTAGAQAGNYTLFVFQLPETKTIYSDDPICSDDAYWSALGWVGWEDQCQSQVPYTDADFLQWFKWTYGLNYDYYTGDPPPFTYEPLSPHKEFSFDYVGSTAPPVAACCSSVLFLPGLEGSILKEGTNTLWPPSPLTHDLQRLALTPDGQSINAITVDGILNDFTVGPLATPVYSGFSTFMNSLTQIDPATGTSTIAAWEPFAYDWRYSPEKIITDGVITPSGTVNIIHEVETLAHNSYTGKVTIVSHSMGGLLGKALIKALEDKGESNLIDSFVMVGVPQLGTPQGIASLLHGDDQGILGGIIVNPVDVRTVGQNMPSAYNLLPSPLYFTNVPDPVIKFNLDASFTQAWRDYWGPGIAAYLDFFSFATGGGVARIAPAPGALKTPAVLSPTLMQSALDFHNQYDSFTFPPSIRVVQVAGWGIRTLKGVEYKNDHFFPTYQPITTVEGDKTVVYPSALSSNGENYFFNVLDYNRSSLSDVQHRDLLSASPIEAVLNSILNKTAIAENTFISGVKPTPNNIPDQLLVSTHSPIILGAYDSAGHFSGVNPGQATSSSVLFTSEGIPGSTFLSYGDSYYLFLPKNGTYNFVVSGTGSGPATVDLESLTGDSSTNVASYSDIPVTPSTSATFVVDSTTPADTHIQVDQNGDGQVDTYVAPDGAPLSLNELLTNLTTAVQGLNIKDKLKTQLLNKIVTIQKKVDKQKQKQSTILAQLKAQIAKQAGKGKIDATSASALSSLLDTLIAQEATIPLDPILIQQLKDQINGASITQSLKTSLLNKVTKLENLSNLTKSLTSFTQTIVNKGSKGQIPDPDVQNILNLLDQINQAL